MPTRELAKIIEHKEVAPGFYRMVLEAPAIAREAKPGQFVHVLVGARDSLDPLLRRPISLHDIDGEKNTLTLLYQVVGRGTEALARKDNGMKLDLMGPLGKGFTLPEEPAGKILVIAGGIGIAPLLPLLKELKSRGRETQVLLGARTREAVLALEEIQNLDLDLQVATDDGTMGHHGFVTELLEEAINPPEGTQADLSYYYACGPEPMLKAVVARLAKAGIPGQVSLEERMGCGVGACLACVCKIKAKIAGPEGEWTYKKVCLEGPVLDAEEVFFHD